MPFGFLLGRASDPVLALCGQLIKVKNTFLDRIMTDGEEAFAGERPSYTCPDFPLKHDKVHGENDSLKLGRSSHLQKTASDSLESSVQQASLPVTMPQTLVEQLIACDLVTPASLACEDNGVGSTSDVSHLDSVTLAAFASEDNEIGSTCDASHLARCDCTQRRVTDWPVEEHRLMNLQVLPQPAGSLTDPAGCSDRSGNLQAVPSAPLWAREHFPYMHEQPSRPTGEFHFDAADSDYGDAVASTSTMADWDDVLTMHCPGLVCSPQMPQAMRKRTKPKKTRCVAKIWCHFYLDEEMTRNGFELNKKVIGHGGVNTRSIYQQTDAKVRLRGRGSGHLEADHREAPVHLMLAVTSIEGQEASFLKALRMSAALLLQVTESYKDFCKYRGRPTPKTPLFWIGELPDKAHTCMDEATGFAVSDTMANFGDLQISVMCEAHTTQQKANVAGKAPEWRRRRK
eukprot:TRINITY_DN59515_c0_g1_i1.p1 TRINITY_DN59515_c0_g1~~TRINITY_DN59515_c0_g1_i1.p1  ORF type:complete len:457 (+),score=80.84 TRINITY_DN59515_c0_g1_i1:63-1433(+)